MHGNEWEKQKVNQDRAGSNGRKCDSQQRKGSPACKSSVLMISALRTLQASRASTVCRTPLYGGELLSKKQNHEI